MNDAGVGPGDADAAGDDEPIRRKVRPYEVWLAAQRIAQLAGLVGPGSQRSQTDGDPPTEIEPAQRSNTDAAPQCRFTPEEVASIRVRVEWLRSAPKYPDEPVDVEALCRRVDKLVSDRHRNK